MESSSPSLDRRSIFSMPEAEKARAVPLGARDGEGDLGEADISLAVPGKAVSHHHHPLRLSIPLPDKNRAVTFAHFRTYRYQDRTLFELLKDSSINWSALRALQIDMDHTPADRERVKIRSEMF